MGRLIIYAGFHKTGTSAMQAALMRARAELKVRGIHYAQGHGKHAQHRLAKISSEHPQEKRLRSIQGLISKHGIALLASEFFSELSEQTLVELKNRLGESVSVEVIFSYRRLEKVVASQYQQFVKTGYSQSLDEFAEAIMTNTNDHHEANLFWRRHSHSEIAKRWAKVFGASNVHIVVADEKNPEVLISWFTQFLGLPAESLLLRATRRMNRSLDTEELAFVRALQLELGEERMDREWKFIFRDTLIAKIASVPSENPNSQSFELSGQIQQHFIALADNEQTALSSSGVLIHGEFQAGASVSSKESASEPTVIHIPTVVRAIASVKSGHYLSQASVGQLVRELLGRVTRFLSRPFTKD